MVVPIVGTIVLRMGTPGTGLSALFGQTRSAVLALLYGRADESFYVRQIARSVNGGLGAIQRELKQLSDAGLIVRSAVGNEDGRIQKADFSQVIKTIAAQPS